MNHPTHPYIDEAKPRRKQSNSSHFIPNVTQFNEALELLPDPELWSDDDYECRITVNDAKRSIFFRKRRISRGSEHPYRWIYDGKILIRKRDIQGPASPA
ncbi:MAG: hypothetical protein AAGC73_09425 [Verrucomicrobiota bacterium]